MRAATSTVNFSSARRHRSPERVSRIKSLTLSGFWFDSLSELEYQNFKARQLHDKDAPCIQALIELALAVQKVKPDWFRAALTTARERGRAKGTVKHCAYRLRQQLVEQVEAYALTHCGGNGAEASAELLRIGLSLVKREARLIPATVTEQVQTFMKLAA